MFARARPCTAAWPAGGGVSRAVLFVLASLGGAAGGCASLPSSALDVAESNTSFEVMTLDPGQEGTGDQDFHGHRILWRTIVTDPATQERIIDIVNSGVSYFASPAKCFNPRHGVRLSRGKRTVDLVICYECSSIQIHDGDQVRRRATIDKQRDLDAEFDKLGGQAPE